MVREEKKKGRGKREKENEHELVNSIGELESVGYREVSSAREVAVNKKKE